MLRSSAVPCNSSAAISGKCVTLSSAGTAMLEMSQHPHGRRDLGGLMLRCESFPWDPPALRSHQALPQSLGNYSLNHSKQQWRCAQ